MCSLSYAMHAKPAASLINVSGLVASYSCFTAVTPFLSTEEGEITELDQETVKAERSEATPVLSEDASRTDCGTTTTDRHEPGSPVTGGTTPRKQFSMDFPPDVMQLVVESEGIPKRWTNIKGILDRGRR